MEVYGPTWLPSRLVVVRCPRCGSVKLHGRWTPLAGDDLAGIVANLLQANAKPEDHVEYLAVEVPVLSRNPETGALVATVEVRARFRGFEEEQRVEKLVELAVKPQLCPTCFRRAAGAVQAIVQVRSWNGKLKPSERLAVEQLIASLPGVSEALVEVEEKREGVDYKLLDQGVARAIAAKLRSALAARVVESHKVVGRKSDGKPKTRLTISVRLPFFRPGSLAVYNGRLVLVEAVSGGRVRFRFVGTKRRQSLGIDEAWKQLQPLPRDAVSYGLVTAVEPGWIHVQVLTPSIDYLELPRRSTMVEPEISVGSEVAVIKLGSISYIVRRDIVS
jgi:nonsense-mediated mRNA decay protein 3